MADVSLPGVLDTIRDIISVKAEQKRLRFLCVLRPDLGCAVRADERRLRQVLLNLLANAVRFTDTGCVSLQVNRAPSGAVRFWVRDSGIGIAADKLTRFSSLSSRPAVPNDAPVAPDSVLPSASNSCAQWAAKSTWKARSGMGASSGSISRRPSPMRP